MIEVTGLVKKYDEHLAVDNLNFTIDSGRVYGFLGPNGAGKSTTLNMITGCLAATEGSIKINGHDIYEEPDEAKKCIGYLPEIPPLYTDMTPYEYLKFVSEIKEIPKEEREVQISDVMEKTQITNVKNRLIKQLSKGYKQRVGIAQAILGYPEIIILDEPTVGLDPIQIIEIRDLIKELGKDHTVILSSHILGEVSAICDYLLIISEGKLVASDTPENLSTKLVGSTKLKITVKGTLDAVNTALGYMSGREETTFESNQDGDKVAINVSYNSKDDLREEISLALAKQNCPVLSMTDEEMSLEDIFLELTCGDDPEAADEADESVGEDEEKGEDK